MRIAHAIFLEIALVGLATGNGEVDAQLVRGELAIGGGTATDQRGIHSSAMTIAPAVLVAPDPRFSAGLSLSGTQFGSSVRAFGGTATLGTRLPMGSVIAFAASASGAATQTSFNATYASADVTPTLEATISGVTLYAGAHVASGATSLRLPPTTSGGVLGAPVLGTRDSTMSRTSAGAVFGGVANIAGSRADEGGSLGYREEHARVGGVSVVDRIATGAVTNGALTLSASGGYRNAADEQTGFGSIAAAVSVSRSAALQAAVGSYPANRITGTVGGQFASIGVVLRGIRRLDDPPASAPSVRGAPNPPAGATRLTISAPGAKRVEVAGDWSRWTPVIASRGADGTWYADVQLPKGEYRYAFRIDGQRWGVPDGVTSVDDGFGGRSAIVTVR